MSDAFPLWQETPPDWPESAELALPQLQLLPHPDGGIRPCLLILPGGGYGHLAVHEGAPVASIAHAADMHAAVCSYRVRGETAVALGLGPLHDAQHAIRLLRHHGADWGMDGRIAVLGFSAGGHLCAATGVHWRRTPPPAEAHAAVSARPDAIVPCYPVICARAPAAHSGSIHNLCGADPDDDTLALHDLPQHIDADTPPVFCWHSADDAAVPLSNSLTLAERCSAAGVPIELHVYPHGRHGLGLAPEDPVVGRWPENCVDWLRRQFATT